MVHNAELSVRVLINHVISCGVQKLSDTKIWRAFSAKAEDVLESARIYIQNRAERDARLLASLGIFTWDRIQKDVARAIPARTTSSFRNAMRNAGMQIGTNSSFTNMQEAYKKQRDEEKAAYIEEMDTSSFDQLNSPLDEIRSVTQSIQDILNGEAPPSSSTTSGGRSGRSLRNVARGGQSRRAERQQRAYQARKKTTLKREKEGVAGVGRAVGSIADTAWEMKRELEVESNRPGYKTESIRNAIEAGAETTARVIAAAREDPKSWRKQLGQAIFGTKDGEANSKNILEAGTFDVRVTESKDVSNIEADSLVVDIQSLQEEAAAEMEIETPAVPEPAYTGVDEFIQAELEKIGGAPFLNADGEIDVDKFIQKEVESIDLRFEIPEITVPDVEIPVIPEEPQLNIPELPVPVELIEEKAIVLERLQDCIENPESTWLTPDVLDSIDQAIDENALRDTVTAMICARDDLEVSEEIEQEMTMQNVIGDLRRVKSTIDMVNSQAATAAGFVAAERLRNILYGIEEEEDGVRPTLEILDEIQNTYATESSYIAETAQSLNQAAVEYRETIVAEREAAIAERESLVAEAQAEREQLIAEAEIALEEAKIDAIQRGIAAAEEFRIAREAAIERGELAAKEANAASRDARLREEEAARRAAVRGVDATPTIVPETVPVVEMMVDAEVVDAVPVNDGFTPAVNREAAAEPVREVAVEVVAEIVDPVVVEPVFKTEVTTVNGDAAGTFEMPIGEGGVAVEVISDDAELDEKFGGANFVSSAGVDEEEELAEKESNVFLDITLRGLDVVFFVVEKIFVSLLLLLLILFYPFVLIDSIHLFLFLTLGWSFRRLYQKLPSPVFWPLRG